MNKFAGLMVCALLLACWQTPASAATHDAPPTAGTPAPGHSSEVTPQRSATPMLAGQFDGVLAGNWRSAAHKARDQYRHPKQTLTFFGVKPDMTVIEIMPGGGWYTELLAPLLNGNGQYIAAVPKSNKSDSEPASL